MRARWVVSLLAPLLGGTLLGCGGASNSGERFADHLPLPPDTMTVKMDQPGRHGGRFVAGATNGPKTFNPVMSNETSSNDIITQMFISLTDLDYMTQEDVPLLAKSWEIGPDGRTVTFHLRRGACFSDGHPITSEDVLFCFDVVMDSTLHPTTQDGLTMTVDGKPVKYTYSAPDSFTFVITAPLVDALMLAHISSVRIVPKHVLEPAFRSGRFASAYGTGTPPESLVTSGPWKLQSFAPNERTVLARNPYWFGVDARGKRLPYLDSIVFLVAPDQSAAALKFQAGELDGLDNVKPEDYATFAAGQSKGHYTLYDVGPSFNTNFFWFNLNRVRTPRQGKRIGDSQVEPYKYAWFSNRDFRRALSMAVDRDAMIRSAFYGDGVKNWGVLTSGNPRWYDSTLTAPDLDPEGAKRLLDRIGLVDRNGDGVREDAAGHPVAFTMVYNGDNKIRQDMATFMKDDFSKIGVRLIPQGLDFNTLVTRTRSDFQYECCQLGLGSAVPSDPGMGANFWKSSGATHYWDMKQPDGTTHTPAEAKLNALFQENLATLDLSRRRAAYHEMSKVLNDECFVIWLPSAILRLPVSDRFGNIRPSPMPHRILWNCDRIFLKEGGARPS